MNYLDSFEFSAKSPVIGRVRLMFKKLTKEQIKAEKEAYKLQKAE